MGGSDLPPLWTRQVWATAQRCPGVLVTPRAPRSLKPPQSQGWRLGGRWETETQPPPTAERPSARAGPGRRVWGGGGSYASLAQACQTRRAPR